MTIKAPFITTYESLAGWKAVHVWWNPDLGGFWEPYETAPWGHETEEAAIRDAKDWAKSEGLEYRPRQS